MPATTTRKRNTARTAAVVDRQRASLADWERHGRTIIAIGDTVAACTFVEEGGDTFVTSAIVELPGGTFGSAQCAADIRDRWMVSDGKGWLDAMFPTVLAAVDALRSPKVRAAMREQTDLRAALVELRRRVRELPAIPGALPTDHVF